MPIRISGMHSGLDTDSIVQELVKAASTKKDKLVKSRTSLQWKQDAWSALNTKIRNFQKKFLDDMQREGSYKKKKTTVSDSRYASVVAGDNAVNGSQSLEIESLAKAGSLTSGRLAAGTKGSTTLGDLGILSGSDVASLNLTSGGATTSIELTADTTISSFVSQMNRAGVTASYDETNRRIFVTAKDSGEAGDFQLTAVNDKGLSALSGLRMITGSDPMLEKYKNYDGSTTSELFQSEYASTKTYYENLLANSESTITQLNTTISTVKESNQSQEQYYLGVDPDVFYADSPEAADAMRDVITALGTGLNTDGTVSDTGRNALTDLTGSSAWTTRVEDARAIVESTDPGVTEEQKDAASKVVALDEQVRGLTGNYSYLQGCEASKTAEEGKKANYESLINDDGGSLTTEVQNALNAKKAAANGMAFDPSDSTGPVRNVGQDAVIYLNGAQFTSATNGFTVNGLTITAHEVTTAPVSISTDYDVDGVYDMVKTFLKQYNSLINEMDKLYNADSAKGYEPLTDDEKAAMTDKQIEQWESKIKDASLRKDGTLSTDINLLKNNMLKGFEVNGEIYTLSSFGINTLGYFDSEENERGAYHIDGDPDDPNTSDKTNKLKSMIATDIDTVAGFFSKLSTNLYSTMDKAMKSDHYRSKYHMYDDKKLKSEYDGYTSKITAAEQRIQELEDRYYDQFSAMEVALSKLNSSSSALTGLLGG